MAPKPVHNQPDIHHFLKQEVKRSDGSFGPVYSCVVKKNSENWYCYVCDAKVGGPIEMHNAGRRHKMRLALPNHPVDLWKKVPNDAKQVVYDYRFAPGEPIPPGMELTSAPETVLQKHLNEKLPLNDDTSAKTTEAFQIVGLEYVVEVVHAAQASASAVARYVCLLCNETRPDCDQCVAHLLDTRHLQAYMSRHFAHTYRFLNSYMANKKYYSNAVRAMRKICESIVKRDGRLMPHSAHADNFEPARNRYLEAIENGLHFFDTETDNFKHLIDIKFITSEAGRDTNSPLSQISSDSNGSLNDATGTNDVEILTKKSSRGSPNESSSRTRSRTTSARDSSTSNSVIRRTHTENNFAFWNSYYNNTRVSNPAKVLRVRKRRSASRSPSPPSRRSSAHNPRRSTDTDASSSRRSFRAQSPHVPVSSTSRNRRTYGRDGESGRRRSRSRSRSRSPSRSHAHHYQPRGVRRSRSRSRDPSTINRWRSVTPPGGRPSRADRALDRTYENSKRTTYDKRVRELNDEMAKMLADHEDNPEDHPLYASEWNQFWNRRYRELQSHDIDPTDYDFKPEWIEFWNQRMKDLHAAELRRRREDLMKMYEIRFSELDPDTYQLLKPKTDDYHERASHNYPHHSHQAGQQAYGYRGPPPGRAERDFIPAPSRSYAHPIIELDEPVATIPLSLGNRSARKPPVVEVPEPVVPDDNNDDGNENSASLNKLEDLNNEVCVTEKDINLVGSLRLLCAVEDRLGASLGPKIVDLLSRALQMEKKEANSAEKLLEDDEIVVLFETAKEKLKGQVLANLIESRRAENAVKDIVRKIAGLVHFANERKRKKIFEQPALPKPAIVTPATPSSVDKMSIAAQITSALLEQGRTDISTEELERLIGTVIGSGGPGSKAESSSASKELYDPESTVDRFTDDELKLLVQNYDQLSDDEQKRLLNYLKTLEANDPLRVRNLKTIISFDKIIAKKSQHDATSNGGSAGDGAVGGNGTSSKGGAAAGKLAEISDDDDDIDYNYDDMFKSVKANLKGKSAVPESGPNTSTAKTSVSETRTVNQQAIQAANFTAAAGSMKPVNRPQPKPVSAPQETAISNKDAGAGSNNDFLTKNFAETQKLIDKIMQDLQAKQKPN